MEWYDAAFSRSARGEGPYKGDWHEIPNRMVTWYPALLLCKGSGPIVEVGCGTGHLAQMCHAFGVEYRLGMDYSKQAISVAQRNAPWAKFRRSDIVDCGWLMQKHQDATIVAIEVFEHIWDDLGFFGLLAKGQTVVLAVPNFHTEGHVRWFADQEQARERYGRVLNIDRVVTEKHARSTNEWFILRGKVK